jgi:hypothetical protein
MVLILSIVVAFMLVIVILADVDPSAPPFYVPLRPFPARKLIPAVF